MASDPSRTRVDTVLAEAWKLYGEGKPTDAAAILEREDRESPGDIEILYALGLALKRSGQSAGAIRSFRQVVQLATGRGGQIRTLMLRRLAQGHVNMLERGAWDLEAETWQRDG